ncbi:maleate cis-trans isomerase family protein [Roseixanthobacter pseudopolyaromaticivorans]|uniref:maleate cis-trans isomerase family protein n=1 Tax=Xanthobacteraceae TaxID=335928 RepID=UPI003727C3DE
MTRSTAPDRQIRIALIVPSSNTVMENDFHRALPKDRFTVHTDRMYLIETTREAEIAMIELAGAAAKDLGTVGPDLLVFGCTSAGALFGVEYDKKLCEELGTLAGCRGMGVISSASQALERAGAGKVALITPYNEDLTRSVAEALAGGGREIVSAHGMGITVNVELCDPTPTEIVAFAKEKLAGQTFDTLFVSCTNFRALEAKAMLEQAFAGVTVITATSAVLDSITAAFD